MTTNSDDQDKRQGKLSDDLMENNEKKDSSIPLRKGPIEHILSVRNDEKLLIQNA